MGPIHLAGFKYAKEAKKEEYMPGDLRQVNKHKINIKEKIERIVFTAKISWVEGPDKNIEITIYASNGKDLIKRIKEVL